MFPSWNGLYPNFTRPNHVQFRIGQLLLALPEILYINECWVGVSLSCFVLYLKFNYVFCVCYSMWSMPPAHFFACVFVFLLVVIVYGKSIKSGIHTKIR